MRQYVVTDEEMAALIASLELTKLREMIRVPPGRAGLTEIDDVFRAFHYQVVRWTQGVGYREPGR